MIESINSAKMLKQESIVKKTKSKPVRIGAYTICKEKGVFFEPPGGSAEPVWLCKWLDVIARTRDKDGMNWGLLVRFKDHDGGDRELNIKSELLASDSGNELIKALLQMGLDIGSGPKAKPRLLEYLQRSAPLKRAKLVYSLGWHDKAFLWPDGDISGFPGEQLVYHQQGKPYNPASVSGSLDEWRRGVAALCNGNSRLMFAVSVAFAAPLLSWLNMQTGGFHFFGESTEGKTTALLVASSVYGRPEDEDRGHYIQRWRATDNALEWIAKAYSGFLLPLDEIKQCDPRIVAETVYMMGNNTGKARAVENGGGKSVANWRLLFLSTGEKTLFEHMADIGKRPDAGAEVRMIAIPSNAGKGLGLFDSLNGFDDGAALATEIKKRSHQYYGSAGRAFIDKLVVMVDALPNELRAYIVDFKSRFLPEKAAGQVSRVAEYFALVAKAGEWATEWGLTGWQPGEAERSAVACMNDWLRQRGGNGNHEDISALKSVQQFFEMYGESAFSWMNRAEDDHSPSTVKRYGYRVKDAALDETFYYVLPEMFKEMCKGFNPKKVAGLLRDQGVLMVNAGPHLTKQKKIPGFKSPQRVYVLTSKVFALTDDP